MVAQEVVAGLFRVEVPLPGNPLRAVNSYVVTGGERPLVVDTGMYRDACAAAMDEGLASLEIAPEGADYFITHFHADHLGLVTRLAGPDSKVYFNQPEMDFLASFSGTDTFFTRLSALGRRGGFPEAEVQAAVSNHPGSKYSPSTYPEFTAVGEGDQIEAGDYRFRCVETPGHTPGHLCLYEPEKRLLLSGDHILGDITPNISLWSEGGNPLRSYLASLEKVRALDVALVLPGHRSIVSNYRERIDELERHHEARTREAADILAEGPATVYEVASHMTWDITAASWADFPVVQKWFAAGEAAAHLKYLEDSEAASVRVQDGIVVYALNGRGRENA